MPIVVNNAPKIFAVFCDACSAFHCSAPLLDTSRMFVHLGIHSNVSDVKVRLLPVY